MENMMTFWFLDAADHMLFVRDDAEEATHTHEEMSLYLLFPYNPEKVIQRGMRAAYTDAAGAVQVFEVRKAKLYEPDHYQEITAEHIAVSELTDEFFPAAEWTDITAQAALTALLAGTRWSVGAVTASGTSSANVSNGNVWQDIRTIESSWNVYITPRITMNASGITGRYLDIAPAGGTWRGLRLSLEKNMDEAGVVWTDTNLKTALYGFGKMVDGETEGESEPLTFADVVWTATAEHPAKPDGQTYLEDPAATAAYGRNGRPRFGYYQNGDISDPEILLQKTWETLRTISVPDVSIDCTVKNLLLLGAADVPIRLHDTALVEIRPTGVILQKEVTRFMEDLLNPLNDRITIGDYIPNIIYINRETADHASGGGGGSGGVTDEEYKIQEFQTEIAANQYEISLRAYQVDLNDVNSILAQAGISLDAYGVITYADDNVNMWQSKLNVQANRIGLVVEGSGENAYIKAASIVAGINAQTGSYVAIEANKIDLTGYVQASDITANYLNAKIATIPTLTGIAASFTGNISTTSGVLAYDVYVGGSGNYQSLSGGIKAIAENQNAPSGQIGIIYTKFDGSTQTVNFNIAATQTYLDGVAAAAAGVTLSGGWTGNLVNGKAYKVTASNGATSTSPSVNSVFANGNKTWAADKKSFTQMISVQDANGADIYGDTLTFSTAESYAEGESSVTVTGASGWSNGENTLALSNGNTYTTYMPGANSATWYSTRQGNNLLVYCTAGGREYSHTFSL